MGTNLRYTTWWLHSICLAWGRICDLYPMEFRGDCCTAWTMVVYLTSQVVYLMPKLWISVLSGRISIGRAMHLEGFEPCTYYKEAYMHTRVTTIGMDECSGNLLYSLSSLLHQGLDIRPPWTRYPTCMLVVGLLVLSKLGYPTTAMLLVRNPTQRVGYPILQLKTFQLWNRSDFWPCSLEAWLDI